MKYILFIMLAIVISAGCSKLEETMPVSEFGGTVNIGTTDSSFIGSKWVIYQYKGLGYVGTKSISDTLIFSSNINYTYRGKSNSFNLVTSTNGKNLTLYGTPFGDITAKLPSNFIEYGEVIQAKFTQLFPEQSDTDFFIWMRKI